jgi:hypothetical protein
MSERKERVGFFQLLFGWPSRTFLFVHFVVFVLCVCSEFLLDSSIFMNRR